MIIIRTVRDTHPTHPNAIRVTTNMPLLPISLPCRHNSRTCQTTPQTYNIPCNCSGNTPIRRCNSRRVEIIGTLESNPATRKLAKHWNRKRKMPKRRRQIWWNFRRTKPNAMSTIPSRLEYSRTLSRADTQRLDVEICNARKPSRYRILAR